MNQDSLHSGRSLWRALGGEPLRGASLEGDQRCEVAVVGAGITGVLLADQLSLIGVDTILLDRETIGTGSTAASTGLLQYEIDTPLVDLIRMVGEHRAVHAYRRGLEAIDELESLISELDENCDFARRSTLCLASEHADLTELRDEADCRRHFDFDVDFLEGALFRDAFAINAPGGLVSRGDGEVNPYRLTQSLAARASRNGGRLFERADIAQIVEHARGVTLSASAGRIEAQAAVLATGYSASPLLPRNIARLQTTYAVASEPISAPEGWSNRCLIWETARPYFYARQTADNRLLIGGEDTDSADDHEDPAFLRRKAERLEGRFKELFPGALFRPQFIWGGTFAETADGLPFIGPRHPQSRVYFALGYGGNGITFSMIAASLIRDLFLGRPSNDAAVFGFSRF